MSPAPRLRLPAEDHVGYPRWVIYSPEHGDLYATLTASKLDQRQVKALTRRLADYLKRPVALVVEYRAQYGEIQRSAVKNPTLVSHGLARAASWHIVSEQNEPLADLYYNLSKKPAAARVARLIANLWGSPVKLLDNASLPAELKSHPRSFVSNPKEPVCLQQVRGRHWVQEWYETAAHDARVRAAQLRKLGYRVTVEGMGSQVMPLGRLNLTLVDYRGGDLTEGNELPPVRLERMTNPLPRGIDRRSIRTVGRGAKRILVGCPTGKYQPRKGRCRAGMRRVNPPGDARPIFDGKYLLVEEAERESPNLGRVRSFTATGRRGAIYGALVYSDGRFHWLNLSRRGSSVPFDLAQVSPLEFTGESPGRTPNPKGRNSLEKHYKTEKAFRQALTRYAASGELVDWFADDFDWVIRLRRIVPSGRRSPNPKGRRNPSYRISATVRQLPEAVPELESAAEPEPEPEPVTAGALALAPTTLTAPAVTLEGRGLVPGERVSVPYTGRSSYFGRKTKRTREHAIVEGYVREGDELRVQVRVHRGRQVEDHVFPEADVRRLPRSSRAVLSSRAPQLRARLERQIAGDPARVAAMLEQASQDFDAADARAHVVYPQWGTQPTREYVNLRSRMHRLQERINMLGLIQEKLAPRLPATEDHWRVANARRRRMLANPGRYGSEYARGVQTFKKWHGFAPHRLTRVKAPRRIPRTMVRLGELYSVVYRSDKWAGSADNPQGRKILYEHTTQRPRPVLATDPAGRDLFIVGGKMRVTAGGLVH
jgi:hypothetical protein